MGNPRIGYYPTAKNSKKFQASVYKEIQDEYVRVLSEYGQRTEGIFIRKLPIKGAINSVLLWFLRQPEERRFSIFLEGRRGTDWLISHGPVSSLGRIPLRPTNQEDLKQVAALTPAAIKEQMRAAAEQRRMETIEAVAKRMGRTKPKPSLPRKMKAKPSFKKPKSADFGRAARIQIRDSDAIAGLDESTKEGTTATHATGENQTRRRRTGTR